MHNSMFSFPKSDLIHAVNKGHLATWPGLTEDAINKYLKSTPETTVGHMNQKRQNTRSTNKKVKYESEDEDIIPQGSGKKTHWFFVVVLDQGQIYTDLTGNFPARSIKGKNVLVVCDNYIRPIAMKSKSGAEWVRDFGIVYDEMTSKGFKPKLQNMENEASVALKKITEKEMSYQLVPPHCHRANAAERAIRTFKEHFKSGLAKVDPAFQIHLWDRLLPHAEITLNILRSSRLHPQLSAAVHYHGLIYYNRTASGSPGCKIIAHENHQKDAPGKHMVNQDGL
jgi:hypothetical protein